MIYRQDWNLPQTFGTVPGRAGNFVQVFTGSILGGIREELIPSFYHIRKGQGPSFWV